MGNSSSSSGRPHDDSVDYGQLVPQGVYTGPRDWNQSITAQLIISRKLAPFYRPLEEYNESWDDDQILAARKPLPEVDGEQPPPPPPPPPTKVSKRPGALKEPSKPEAAVYRGAVECPICFLYYPPNINHSRCCDQAICTECFVQIKRNEPTTTHLVSEPAACPYCVQENFGIVYNPPPWRAGINSEGSSSPWSDSPKGSSQSIDTSPPYPTHKRRQKSFGADSPEVVLIDHIRPDWEAKLAAVRAAVARRANRRIIMRQVGDRLIPVGVTSGRVHALSPEEAAQAAEATAAEGTGSRRSRRRQQQAPNGNFEQFMGMGGQELEELMVMEAMRLSLIEHEEQQRKEAEEKKKAEAAAAITGSTTSTAEESTSAAPGPGPSTMEARSSNVASSATLTPTASPSSASFPRPSSSLSVNRNPPRSRSPSPNPLQALKDTASGWRRRTSSPPPFSTLGAALDTVSNTVAAVINGVGPAPSSPPAQQETPVRPSSPVDPIPTITVADSSNPDQPSTRDEPITNALDGPSPSTDNESTSNEPTVNVPSATMSKEPTVFAVNDLTASPSNESEVSNTPRPTPKHQDSLASTTSASSSLASPVTYDNLPSSPESIVAHQPLLGSEPETPTTPKHSAFENGTESSEYLGGASTTRE